MLILIKTLWNIAILLLSTVSHSFVIAQIFSSLTTAQSAGVLLQWWPGSVSPEHMWPGSSHQLRSQLNIFIFTRLMWSVTLAEETQDHRQRSLRSDQLIRCDSAIINNNISQISSASDCQEQYCWSNSAHDMSDGEGKSDDNWIYWCKTIACIVSPLTDSVM